MIHRIYEYLLMREINKPPREICFMLTVEDLRSAPHRISEVVAWADDVAGIEVLTFYIDSDESRCVAPYIDRLKEIGAIAHLHLHIGDEYQEFGSGMTVMVVAGKSGREEITESIRRIAAEGVDPCDVTEEMIESHLTFRSAPDLIIKPVGAI